MLPWDNDLGRPEQRERGPPTVELCSARHGPKLHRHCGDLPSSSQVEHLAFLTVVHAENLCTQEDERCSPIDTAHTSNILQRGDSGADRPLHLIMAQKPEAGRPCTSYKGVYTFSEGGIKSGSILKA